LHENKQNHDFDGK